MDPVGKHLCGQETLHSTSVPQIKNPKASLSLIQAWFVQADIPFHTSKGAPNRVPKVEISRAESLEYTFKIVL